MSEQEKEAFNARFEAYEGSNVTGGRIKSLIQAIISLNNANNGEDNIVKFNEVSTVEELINAKSNINSAKVYKVFFEYNDKGYTENTICEETTEQ